MIVTICYFLKSIKSVFVLVQCNTSLSKTYVAHSITVVCVRGWIPGKRFICALWLSVNNEISLIEQGFFCEFAFEVRTLSNSNLNFVTSLLKGHHNIRQQERWMEKWKRFIPALLPHFQPSLRPWVHPRSEILATPVRTMSSVYDQASGVLLTGRRISRPSMSWKCGPCQKDERQNIKVSRLTSCGREKVTNPWHTYVLMFR